MANELNTLQKGTIDDDTSHALPGGGYVCTSDDTTVATTAIIGGYWFCVAQAEGTAGIHAVRSSDGATGDFTVTVTAAPAPGTFVIVLGALSPKG